MQASRPIHAATSINSNPKSSAMSEDKRNAFEQAGKSGQSGLISEFVHFLKHNKKFWLIPLLLVLLSIGLLLILGGTAAAPFIYTLF